MKKLLFTLCMITGLIIFLYGSAYAQDDTTDDLDEQIKIGSALLFGSDVESLGIQANGVYRFTEEVEGAADFSIFFPGNNSGFDSFWAFNFNAHYLFSTEDEYHLYGLGGLNIATAEIDATNNSNTEIGINLGIGGEYHLDSFSLFGEIKYVVSDLDQLVLGAGVRFPLTLN